MSRSKRSNRFVGSAAAHVASLCCISLIIKGLHLVRSDRVHSKQLKLLPFAMWPAFPASDYYGSSASMTDIGVNSLAIPLMPSLVHMLDYQRIGEVAGRSLFPCLLQVDAVASGLAVFSTRPTQDALHLRSRSVVSGYISIDTIQHSAC